MRPDPSALLFLLAVFALLAVLSVGAWGDLDFVLSGRWRE